MIFSLFLKIKILKMESQTNINDGNKRISILKTADGITYHISWVKRVSEFYVMYN